MGTNPEKGNNRTLTEELSSVIGSDIDSFDRVIGSGEGMEIKERVLWV